MIRCSKCGRIAVSEYCCGQRVETIGAASDRIRNSAEKEGQKITNEKIKSGKIVDLCKKGFSSFSEIYELFTLNERKYIETLWLSGNKIKNLDGLELFPNLTELVMDSNELNDISNLPKRDWKHLNFENNLISEIPSSFYSVINNIDLSKFGKYACHFTLYFSGNPLIDGEWSKSIDFEKILSNWYNSDLRGDEFPTLYLGPIDQKLSALILDVSIGEERGYISHRKDQESNKILRELCGMRTINIFNLRKAILIFLGVSVIVIGVIGYKNINSNSDENKQPAVLAENDTGSVDNNKQDETNSIYKFNYPLPQDLGEDRFGDQIVEQEYFLNSYLNSKPNFNEYYISWSSPCGGQCISYLFIDTRTGKTIGFNPKQYEQRNWNELKYNKTDPYVLAIQEVEIYGLNDDWENYYIEHDSVLFILNSESLTFDEVSNSGYKSINSDSFDNEDFVSVEEEVEEIIEEEIEYMEAPPVAIVTPPKPPPVKPDLAKVEEKIWDLPDEYAEFPGGDAALKRFIHENITFPEICMDMNAQGRVFAKFCVEKNGSITNITIERDRTGCNDFAKAVKRVLRMMPKWAPGEVGGAAKRTFMRYPFNFTISN